MDKFVQWWMVIFKYFRSSVKIFLCRLADMNTGSVWHLQKLNETLAMSRLNMTFVTLRYGVYLLYFSFFKKNSLKEVSVKISCWIIALYVLV